MHSHSATLSLFSTHAAALLCIPPSQISHEDAEIEGEFPAKYQAANRQFISWLRRVGVPLLPHRLFYDQLPMKHRRKRTRLNPNLNVGAFGRMDMGLLVDAMRSELLSRGLDPERVLYTDTDVLFAGDVDYEHLASLALPTLPLAPRSSARRSTRA